MVYLKQALKTTQMLELDLSGNPIGTIGAKELAEYLQHPTCFLEKLDLIDCKFQWDGCNVLLNAVKLMKRLILDRNDLSTRGKMNQLQNIPQRVNYLSMARCNLKDDAGSYLSFGIQSHGFQTLSHAKA